MRRILINQHLKDIVSDFNKQLFSTRDAGRFEMPAIRLQRLKRMVTRFPAVYEMADKANKMVEYITKIENEYLAILNADERKIASLMQEFDKIIDHKIIAKKNKFWTSIVCCMGYEDLRDREFMSVLEKLQIRTCVYCNSQLTLVVRKALYLKNYPGRGVKKGDVRLWKGLLQLDHRHAKSKYPFLSTSFYNLYPSCSNCNQAKSDDPCDFALYTDGADLDAFKFGLGDNALVNYWHTRDKEDLVVKVTPILPGSDQIFSEKYENTFSVFKIYNTQKDIVEELVHKAEVYTKDYNATLVNSFSKLFPDQAMLNRLIVGNYDQPEDIHKRPLAKFMQEIARDLKLIK